MAEIASSSPETAPEVDETEAVENPTGESGVGTDEAIEIPSEDRSSSIQPAAGKRFLGGQSSASQYRAGFPSWFKLLLLGIATLLSLAAFLVVANFSLAESSEKAWLTALVETEYLSPAIPPLEMAHQDAKLIRSAIGTSMRGFEVADSSTEENQDAAVKRFFDHQLANIDGTTCVVYVAAHAVSDERTGYILYNDSHPSKPETGYPIRRLLDALVQCPAKNKLLVLDVCRLDHNLRLGMLGNDFVFHLKREFENLRHQLVTDGVSDNQNLWILSSCDDGQIALSSPTLGASPFALAVAYGLRGGSEVDAVSNQTRKQDGRISAAELANYVMRSVSSWSLEHRDAEQTPFVLSLGSDFPLANVDRSVTISNFIQEAGQTHSSETDENSTAPSVTNSQSNPTDEKAEEKSEAADESVAKTDSPTEPAAQESPAAADPTVESLVAEIAEQWRQGRELLRGRELLSRPLQWSLLVQSLNRAEGALFSDDPSEVLSVLQNEIPKRLKYLDHRVREQTNEKWSLSFVDGEQSKWRELIANAVAKPSAANLSSLRDGELIEAGFILSLAQECQTNGVWHDPKLIRLALETRTRGELAAIRQHPYLLPFARAEIEVGDQLRRRAEIDLVIGRSDRAEQGLRAAQTHYDRACEQIESAMQRLGQVQRMTVNLTSVMEWIGNAPHWGTRKSHDLELFNQFVRELTNFTHDPTTASLEAVADTATNLKRRGSRYAEDALQPTEWARSHAALALPFLQPELRAQLLHALLAQPAPLQLKTDFRMHVRSGPQRPAMPYPLADVFSLLLAEQDLNIDGAKLISQLRSIGPVTNRQPVMWQTMAANDRMRQDRAIAARDIRHYFSQMRNTSIQDVNQGTWWQRWVRLLMLSDWRAIRFLNEDPRDVAMNDLVTEAKTNYLKWTIGRLYSDSMELPGFCYGRPIAELSDRVREQDADFRTPKQADCFAVVGDMNVSLSPGESKVVPLTIKTLRRLSTEETPRLVLERTSGGKAFRFALDEVEDVDGQLSVKLEAPFVSHEQRQAWLKLTLGEEISTAAPPELAVRVELASGQVDWLPVPLNFVPTPVKPAELILGWDDSRAENGRIDLFPNQQVPLNLAVRKNSTAELALQLEFLGSEQPQIIPLVLRAEQTGELPVPVPTDLALPLDQTLVVRLRQGETVLDERELEVALLDLQSAFHREVRYDPQMARAIVQVKRVRQSDAATPVPFELQLLPDRASRGKLAGVLPISTDTLQLDAIVPGGQNEEFRTILTGAGVPRIFRDQLGLTRLVGQAVRQLHLELLTPQPEAKMHYRAEGLRISVVAQLDGPRDIQYEIGLDLNRNGELEGFERQHRKQYWNGREAGLKLVATVKPPALYVESNVSDITVDIDASGASGRQTIIARAIAGSQETTAQLPIFLLASVPPIEVLAPSTGAKVSWGEPVTILLKGGPETAAAIDRIAFAFDINENGAVDDGETVTPLGIPKPKAVRFGRDSRIAVQLPTKGLPAGPVTLLVQASVDLLPDHSVATKPSKKSAQAKNSLSGPLLFHRLFLATEGEITGQVVTPDGLPRRGAVVTLIGIDQQVSGPRGEFTFQDVPAGKYKIVARTSQRTGSGFVTVKPGQASNLEIKIAVQ